MSGEPETLEVARAGVEAFQRGDIEGVLDLIHEGGEIYLPPDLPNSGTYHGRQGFLVWMRHWLEAWEEFQVELGPAEQVGARHVVAKMHQSGRGKGSGIAVEMDIAYMWEVRDAKIAAMHLYATVEQARRVAERRERDPLHRIAAGMTVKAEAVGKQWPSASFEVEAARIRQYASAVGEDNPIYHDADAAKAAGFRDLVAPPMFCVVYSAPALGPAILDPEVGINIAAMVHGGQEFRWGEPVCAGDTITTTATCKEIYEKDGRGFYVFESVSTNQDGEETVRGTWTDIVRGV